MLDSEKYLLESYHKASLEVLNRKHGNGNERIQSLRKIGFSDIQISKIQNLVNKKVSESIKEYSNK